jgi:integrase
VPRANHISRRRNSKIYQVRLRVPLDLVDTIKRKELTKSLGTTDYAEAKKLSRVILAGWEQDFDDIRNRRDLTENDLHHAMTEHYRSQLDRDDLYRQNLPTTIEIEAARQQLVERARSGELEVEQPFAMLAGSLDYLALEHRLKLDQKRRAVLLDDLKRQVAEGQTDLIRYAADEFITRHRLNIETDSPAYRQLCHRLARGEIEFLKRTFERDSGDFGGQPNDPLLSRASTGPMVRTTFDDIITEQEKQSAQGIGRNVAASTIYKYRGQMKGFTDWRRSTQAATVTKAEVERWRDMLLADGKNRKTARDKVGSLRSVLMWGQKQSDGKLFPDGFVMENVLMPTAVVSDSAVKTYTVADARKLLKAARERPEPHFRWLPWMAAYSGARIGELLQLTKADIIKIGGYHFYHIQHDPANGRTTKTKKSRKVPIHPAMIKEGFLKFVSEAADGPLFTASRAYQNMTDWIRTEVFKGRTGPRPAPSHGFRHLFQDLRFGKISQEGSDYITGRASAGSAALYGKSDAMLPELAKEIAKFPMIDT